MSLVDMATGQYRLAVLAVGTVIALLLAAAGGAWLVAGYYRPLLDQAENDLATCRATRENLESQVGEQSAKEAQLRLDAEQREKQGQALQGEAAKQAGEDYAAANRIMQEQKVGDQCKVVETIIDQELGL